LSSIKKHNGSVPPQSSLLSPIFVTRNFQTCAITLLFKWGIHNQGKRFLIKVPH
jgi:hypothetical protein